MEPMTLRNNHISMGRPVQITPEGVWEDHVNHDDFIWSNVVPPGASNVGLPSSPILLKFEKAWLFTITRILNDEGTTYEVSLHHLDQGL